MATKRAAAAPVAWLCTRKGPGAKSTGCCLLSQGPSESKATTARTTVSGFSGPLGDSSGDRVCGCQEADSIMAIRAAEGPSVPGQGSDSQAVVPANLLLLHEASWQDPTSLRKKFLRAHRRVSLACVQIRGILGWADEVSRGSPAQVCRGVPVSVALLRLAAIAGHTACQSCVFASR